MNLDQRRHFQKLFRGTGQMVHELCQAGSYQEGKVHTFFFGAVGDMIEYLYSNSISSAGIVSY